MRGYLFSPSKMVKLIGVTLACATLSLTACNKDEDSTSASPKADTTGHVKAKEKAVKKLDIAQAREKYKGVPLKVLDVSERTYQNKNHIAIRLSVPIDPAGNYNDVLFAVNKTTPTDEQAQWRVSESGKLVYLMNTQPNTNYEIQVKRGLTAVNEQRLVREVEQNIKTRRLMPSVNFAGRGTVLPLYGKSGVPITVLDVPKVQLDVYRVRPERLIETLPRLRSTQNTMYRWHTREFTQNLADLVYTGNFDTQAKPHTRTTVNLPLREIEAMKQPGVYLLFMHNPTDYASDEIQFSYVTLTDIGLHMRQYDDEWLISATHLKTAKPYKGIEVSFFDVNNDVVSTVTTDDSGLAQFSRHEEGSEAKYLVAQNEESFTILDLQAPALDLSDFSINTRLLRETELYLFGMRDLYRPGERVVIDALLRDADGKAVDVGDAPMLAKLENPQGQVKDTFSWSPEKDAGTGYYRYDYTLPTDSDTGNWTLRVEQAGQHHSYTFKVEEFLPERLKLTFNPDGDAPEVYSANDKIELSVLAEYLYGAPASGNAYSGAVQVYRQRHPFKAFKAYEFGNIKENLSDRREIDKRKLDKQGETVLRLDSDYLQEIESPAVVSVNLSVFESGGRPITRRHNVTVVPNMDMVGIRPSYASADAKDKQGPDENSLVEFDLIAVNASGERIDMNDIQVVLIREDRRYFWEYNDSQGWHYEYSDSEYPEQDMMVNLSKTKPTKVSVPVEWGRYRLEVRQGDSAQAQNACEAGEVCSVTSSRDEAVISSTRFFAGENWYANWEKSKNAGQSARPDKVTLAWDKKHYTAGDVAKLNIVPPRAGQALVMVESNKMLFSEVVDVPSLGKTVDIKIGSSPSWQRHDLFASVVHIQSADEKNKITAKRAIGLIHLPLNRDSRKLNVQLDVPEKLAPSKTANIGVKVDNAQNKNVHVLFAAVDVGVLNITDFETPNPYQYFFEPKRYSVDMLDMYQKLIEINEHDMAKLRFGGDAELSQGGEKAQSEVRIISIIHKAVALDANGEAEIALDVPDFNGSLRLMAVAYSDEDFGATDKTTIVAAPLVTQLSIPRFLASNDESSFALDLHNLTEGDAKLSVSLTADAPVVVEKSQRNITLKPNEKSTLVFDVTAKGIPKRSQIKLSIKGNNPEFNLDKDWHIQMRSPYPALIEQEHTWLAPGETFTMPQNVFDAYVAGSATVRLSANSSPDFNMQTHLEALLKYPYGCLEQATSSTYPWVFSSDERLESLGVKNTTGKNRDESLKEGFERIYSRQLSNGGYALWDNKGREEFWLTAYVGDFLSDAREQGIDVNTEAFNKTMKRLEKYYSRKVSTALPWVHSNEHYIFAFRAYSAYVLSRHNKGSLSQLRALAKDVDDAKSALPIVHLAIAVNQQGDPNLAQELMLKAENKLLNNERENYYYGDYGSPLRDATLSSALLYKHKMNVDLARTMLLDIADLTRGRQYLSTQERNALYKLSVLLDMLPSDQWQIDLALRKAKDIIKRKGKYTVRIDAVDLVNGLEVLNSGDVDVMINTQMQGVAKSPPEPQESDNLRVVREYYLASGDNAGKRIGLNKLNVGDLVLVRITTRAKNKTPDALVVDLLPSGLELENQNLDNSVDMKTLKVGGKTVQDWMKQTDLVHQEYRDDRYVAAIRVYGQADVFYLARAVTPGQYAVPPTLVEDMYRPEDRAVGATVKSLTIVQKKATAQTK